MAFYKPIVFLFFILPVACNLFAQNDSATKKIIVTNNSAATAPVLSGGDGGTKPKRQKINILKKIDTAKPYTPKIAIVRSAVLPGWGQATNKKYWKVPVVLAALGTTTYIFFRNIGQFREANKAYKNSIDGNTGNDNEIPEPYYSVRLYPERIKNFRNQVRQNIDYSVLFFIAFWGLNVVDATVDAHLKTFDVSDNLSLQIKPGYSPMANTNGISLVLNIGRVHSK